MIEMFSGFVMVLFIGLIIYMLRKPTKEKE